MDNQSNNIQTQSEFEQPSVEKKPKSFNFEAIIKNTKTFLREIVSLFKTNAWHMIATMITIALITSVIIAPIAFLSGTRSVLDSTPKYVEAGQGQSDDGNGSASGNEFEGLESWEECARKYLASCEIGYVQTQDYNNTTLFVYVDSVDSVDTFVLSASALGYLISNRPDGLEHLDYINISFLDCTLILTPNEDSLAPTFYSMLLADETNPRYSEIRQSYDEWFELYKLDD